MEGEEKNTREWTYIRIRPATKQMIRKYALYGDNWDMVILRMVNMLEKR